MQAGPISTRSVRPATAASNVNASSRRLTNSASPHQTESSTGAASTASASASRSRAVQSPTSTPRLESVIPKFISALDHRHEVALDKDAGLHRHFDDLPRRTRCWIGKHLHPFVVDRLARELLHPHRDLDDVVDRGAAGLDGLPQVLEHEGALLLERGRELAGRRIVPANETRHDDVADPARVRDRRLVSYVIDIDAAARHPRPPIVPTRLCAVG